MLKRALSLLFITFIVITNCVSCDVILNDNSDTEVIEAVDTEIYTEPEELFEKDRPDRDTPVSYHGAQLWRVPYNDQNNKNAVSELQKQYQAAMWNLQMANNSNPYVDMFVKRAAVSDAKSFMKKARIPFDVLIENVQSAIDTENPPLDDIDLWVNRNGKKIEKFLHTSYRE